MPILDTIIPEITKQVIEPVSEQITRRLLSILGIAPMFKDSLFIVSDDLKASNYIDNESGNMRVVDNRCDVTVIPNYNPLDTAFDVQRSKTTEANAQTNRWTYGEYPIFSDQRTGAYLFEVDVPCSVELDFVIRVKSIELADLISSSLFVKSMTGGAVFDYSDIVFSYPLTDRHLILLYQLYKLQDDVVAKMTFKKYLTTGSNSAITALVNRDQVDDGSKAVVIQRSNVRVLGKLTYDGNKPDPDEVNKHASRYTVNFNYVYQFARPALMRASYPIMVNNKLLEMRFIRSPQKMSTGDGKKVYPDISINKYFMSSNKATIDLSKEYPKVVYPDYDDWQCTSATYPWLTSRYQQLFVGLLSIDVNSDDGSLSLTVDLPNEVFPLLRSDITASIEKVLNMYQDGDPNYPLTDVFRRLSVIDISIFSNENMVDFNHISIDANFRIRVLSPLKITKRYRLMISQVSDISYLDSYYIYYLLNNSEYYAPLLARHIDFLVERGYVKILSETILESKTLTTGKWKTPSNRSMNYGTGRAITIGRYTVEVRKRR